MERLTKVRLFAGMTREGVAEVLRSIGGEVRQFKKGEALVYEGTKAKWVVPILSGRITIFESGSGGVRRPVSAAVFPLRPSISKSAIPPCSSALTTAPPDEIRGVRMAWLRGEVGFW